MHVGLGVLLNDPFGESIASISIPLSLSLSFNLLLPNQKKFLNGSISVRRVAKGDGSTSDFDIEVRNAVLECASFKCSGIRVNECSTNFNPVTNPTITKLCNNRDINVG